MCLANCTVCFGSRLKIGHTGYYGFRIECGSGSGTKLISVIWLSWILIRIGKADPDTRGRKLTKIKK